VNTPAATSWGAEYASGRYHNEPPVSFAYDVIDAARSANLSQGLYIGCGNGRNLVPMSDAGLDLIGLDVSFQAITQLHQRKPGAARLIVGELTALQPSARFEMVIGIQVFQHGRCGQAHDHLARAAAHVAPGGLLCVRVNATATDIRYDHQRTETADDASFTVHYLSGPKTGLDVHFFTAPELEGCIPDGFSPILPLRLDRTPWHPPASGYWSQWEAIWQRHKPA